MKNELDPFDSVEYFKGSIENPNKFKMFLEQSVAELDPTALAFIVDNYLEQYMEREGVQSLTKRKGNSVLERVYVKDEQS
jgi:hypothetical protein